MADRWAKQAGLQNAVPQDICLAFRNYQRVNTAAAVLIARIQLHRLKARARTVDCTAIKVRKRPAVALPRRCPAAKRRRRGVNQVRPAEEEVMEALLHPSARRRVQPAVALDACWNVPARAAGLPAGVRDLWPLGPLPLEGALPAKNGRLPLVWQCRICLRMATDSSCGGTGEDCLHRRPAANL